MKRELSDKQRQELLKTLKARFEKNMDRHMRVDWAKVQASRSCKAMVAQ
jgi:F0F1-type ATP synthase delta subunit